MRGRGDEHGCGKYAPAQPWYPDQVAAGSRPNLQLQLENAAIAIVENNNFWSAVTTLVKALCPVCKCLRLPNSTSPGMDKICCFAQQTFLRLKGSAHAFDDKTFFDASPLDINPEDFLEEEEINPEEEKEIENSTADMESQPGCDGLCGVLCGRKKAKTIVGYEYRREFSFEK